ncbi:MAG: glycosyltransferase family 2 protein [Candidatus Verstraetearchaeota archaeon]|nr:glycosyltransferase family 2 protein [Candidatus Verstraetearchaeota archaeon]
MVRVSVIIPSKEGAYLKYVLSGLMAQTMKPSEIILVLKACNINFIEKLCKSYNLSFIILEQKKGYFTHALNMGKREAKGDIVVFTDEDVILPKKWLQRFIELHNRFPKIVGIFSRDFYINIDNLRLYPTPDDKPIIRLSRWFIKTWLEQPHPLLKKYRLGVYITKRLEITHGPFIPFRTCYSLPFRGVNMSYKNEYIHDVWFPEHFYLKRGIGNECYFGLQLIMKGLDMIYVPNNPVLHIYRKESLSRTEKHKEQVLIEKTLMKSLYTKLIKGGMY